MTVRHATNLKAIERSLVHIINYEVTEGETWYISSYGSIEIIGAESIYSFNCLYVVLKQITGVCVFKVAVLYVKSIILSSIGIRFALIMPWIVEQNLEITAPQFIHTMVVYR